MDKHYKVWFVGASSTGKSTILNHYKELGYNCITEVVRTLAKTKGIHVNEMGDEEGQNTIFTTYQQIFSENENYISDRGLIDVNAYSYIHSQTNSNMVRVAADELMEIKEFIKNNPDLIVCYFPIEFDNVDDGFRSTDEMFRHHTDQLIHSILLECKIPYVEVRGTVEERIAIIDKYLNHIG